ncbi:MFS transporter [Streptomyces flavofungini]|uniref:MFS transporter n=1 Tax=Streptomyces flavofungini TaxID=68200 RepID=UPI0034DF133E
MTGYRQVLAVPGMAALLGVSFLARTAITAAVMALTMYVVLDLDRSYAAAGVVAAALTAGLALGGPVLGRLTDRRGLRVVLRVTVVGQAVFWLSVPFLSYAVLLGAAFTAGLLMVPAQSVTRQAVVAMTTAGQRRAAFALEAVQGELSYMVGPAAVILGAATLPPGVAVWGVGAAIVVGGAGLRLLDPPLRAKGEAPSGEAGRAARRAWAGTGMTAVLLTAFGTTMLLSGVDLAIVATLEEGGQVSWAALVVAVFGLASVVGGLVYGALPRSLPAWALLGLLGLVTVPAGLAHHWLWLCAAVVVIGAFTAPTLSVVADTVGRLAPAGARGEATGLQSSAQSAGFALGAPLVGLAIDASVPAGGFAAAGAAGLLAALTGWLLSRGGRRAGHGAGTAYDLAYPLDQGVPADPLEQGAGGLDVGAAESGRSPDRRSGPAGQAPGGAHEGRGGGTPLA